MGSSNIGYVMTLANSIIGVGILAMPFCFQKCGILLSIVLLILSNFMTRLCCHYLLKSSIRARRKNFEFLASYLFGSSGKLIVELCIIGYLMGTCITYYVVVGDLGPQIVSHLFNIVQNDSLRTMIMVIVTVICIIPLGLLKNIESLSHVCIVSIIFYFCLVVKIMFESEEKIASGNWYDHIHWWRMSGMLQCLPIFSMSLACQMQLFEIYDSLPNPSLDKMNEIVKVGTNICTSVYILVGLFGYIAFSGQPFSGNILLSFSSSFISEVIKLGFLLTVAFSFPLLIFPCRASLYSLLYHRSHADTAHYIPEHRFKYLTVCIVLTSLTIGILIPSIEVIIGLVGSTIGIAICIMFPASCFVKTSKKNSTEKLLAQFLLVLGVALMILGTYSNLVAMDEQSMDVQLEKMAELRATIANPIPVADKINRKEEQAKQEKEQLNKMDEPPPLTKADREIPVKKKVSKTINSIHNDHSGVREINLSEKKNGSIKVPQVAPLNVVDVPKVDNHVEEKPKAEPKDLKPSVEEKPVKTELPVVTKPDSSINKDAIQKEDQEMAIGQLEESGHDLQKTKKILEEVKNVLAKQNQETQKLVLEKIDKISEKVNKIEKLQEIELKNDKNGDKAAEQAIPNKDVHENENVKQQTAQEKDAEIKKLLEPPIPVGQLLAEKNQNLTKKQNTTDAAADAQNIPIAKDPISSVPEANPQSIGDHKEIPIQLSNDPSQDIKVAASNQNIGRDLLSQANNNDNNRKETNEGETSMKET